MRAFSSFRRSRSRQSSGSISSDAAGEDHIKDEEENATAAADNDSEADNKEFESLQPGGFIANRVLKLNHHNLWDKRWAMLDDTFGVLFVFRKRVDFDRRTPQHIYLMSELSSATPMKCAANSHGLIAEFSKYADTGIPARPLTYAFEKQALVDRWAALMSQMMKRAKKGDIPIARGVHVEAPGRGKPELGVTLRNIDNCPLGVGISSLEEASPLKAAGLQVNDIILAVNDTCCLSHSHAQELLDTAGCDRRFELIVWSSMNSSAVDIS